MKLVRKAIIHTKEGEGKEYWSVRLQTVRPKNWHNLSLQIQKARRITLTRLTA
jgi:hypothetical protein